MSYTRVAFVAALALLASCKDSSGPSGLSGTVSFSYSGGTSGSFTATGAVPAGQPETSQWALGFRSEAEQAILVTASRPRSSSTHDWMYLQIDRLTVGSSTISDTCQANNCTAVIADFNVNNSTSESEFFCGLTAGTVTITSISSGRVQGTFSGTGECVTSTGTTSFAVTNGSFDVAFVTGIPGL